MCAEVQGAISRARLAAEASHLGRSSPSHLWRLSSIEPSSRSGNSTPNPAPMELLQDQRSEILLQSVHGGAYHPTGSRATGNEIRTIVISAATLFISSKSKAESAKESAKGNDETLKA